MRTLLHTILWALVDAKATEHIDAGMHEQIDTRTTQRNCSRTKMVSTTPTPAVIHIHVRKGPVSEVFPMCLRHTIDYNGVFDAHTNPQAVRVLSMSQITFGAPELRQTGATTLEET